MNDNIVSNFEKSVFDSQFCGNHNSDTEKALHDIIYRESESYIRYENRKCTDVGPQINHVITLNEFIETMFKIPLNKTPGRDI